MFTGPWKQFGAREPRQNVDFVENIRLSLGSGQWFNPRMTIANLTPSQLRQAADLKEKIEALETELAVLSGGNTPAPAEAPEPAAPAKPGRRTMSPAHKAKIRAAQKIRWANYNAGKTQPAVKPAKRGPNKMSAAGRAAISAAAKARWAKIRAAKKA